MLIIKKLFKAYFNRIMILDIHCKKNIGMLKGKNPEEQYEYYEKNFLYNPAYLQSLFAEFPELERLLQQSVVQQEEMEHKIKDRLEQDREEITELFCENQSFGSAVEIDLSVGDTHNGGCSTTKVILDNGVTLYYKNHKAQKAQWYQELYRYLCKKTGITCKEVRCLVRETYGWEEKIEKKDCKTKEEIERYYFRLGIHLCIGYVLSATDLHGENIIAHGEHPVIVDYETFPGYYIKKEESSAERKSETILGNSVIHTGMLPILTWGKGENTVLMSAVGNECRITTPFRMPVVKKDKTSDMYIDYEHVEIELKECVVYFNGKPVRPEEYMEELIRGFQAAYRVFVNDAEAVRMSERFFMEKARIILRHTQQYAMYRTVSLHPDYMKSRDDRVKLLQIIHKEGEAEIYRQIRDYEIECLAELDIPYFEICGDSRDIFCGNSLRIPDFLDKTPREQWMNHIKELSEKDLNRQSDFIRLSMGLLGEKKSSLCIAGEDKADKYRISRMIKRMADWLCDTAVITEKLDITWIGLNFLKRGGWKLHAVGMYLYGGISGIAVFLGEYLKSFKDKRAQWCFELAVNKMKRYTEKFCSESVREQPVKTGIVDGEASLVWVYLQLFEMSGDIEYLDYASRHFRGMKRYFYEDHYFDLLSGNAGAILAAIHLYQTTGEKEYLDMAEELERCLWEHRCEMESGSGWKIPGMEIPLAGMAHGNSGFLLAYTMLYKAVRKKEYLDKIKSILTYEDSLYSEEYGNWLDLRCPDRNKIMNAWCHGAPGILLARMELKEIMGNAAVNRDIGRCVKGILQQKEMNKICICHGVAGNLIILDRYSKSFKDGMPDGFTVVLKARLLQMLEQSENISVTESRNPAFMNGISGVGYVLLKLYNNAV